MKLHLGKPTGRRRSFRILRQIESQFETVKDRTLDSINQNLKTGKIDLVTAEKNVRALIKQLSPKADAIIHNKDNDRILQRYWEDEYSHRDLVDPDSERYALERAVRAAGNLSLQSVTREQLQKQINIHFKGNKQRRIVSKLNQLLKWIGRDFTLRLGKESIEDVRHLNEADFLTMIKKLDDPFKTLHEVCFYGGFRIGEAFALDPKTFNEESSLIKVLKQVDKFGVKRRTKNSKHRDVFVFPQGHAALTRWFDIRSQIDLPTRKLMSKVTRRACKLAFPKDPSKWLTFHDTRHCYAIMLLSKGVTTSLVAQSIGDAERVVEKYYTGFILSSDSVKLIGNLVSKKPG